MAIKIITDTSCDLPDEELEKNGIEMIPLKVTFENGETFLDRYEINPSYFVKRMADSKKLPKTAAPDPATFLDYFERGLKECGEVLFISLSSGLSSTYHTAQLACSMLANQKIKVVDSLTASLGTGIMAINAAQMAAAGMSMELIISELIKVRSNREVIFVLDTLDNVVKGCRLSRVEGAAGTLLNIKPILRGDENGVPYVIEKVRGNKKAVQRLLDMMGELGGDTLSKRIVGISHVECIKEARALAEKVNERYNPVKVLVANMGATIGTYAGAGAIMINF